MDPRSFVLSAIISGVVIGFVGNLPMLDVFNGILCIWVWLGGILAVFLYHRYQHGASGLSIGQAVFLGAVSGFIGALVGLPINLVTGPLSMSIFAAMARSFQAQGNMPLPKYDTGSTLAFAFGSLFIDLFLYTLFGAMSAMIAASLFWKKPQTGPAATD